MRCASNEDELQEPMRGTARAQTMAPDGRRLYTLYTRDATATEPAESFVHVLDLERERATCIDLPAEFASSPVGAVAVSPSGTRLYVVAPAAGALAEIDTAALRVTRTAHLPEPSTETMVRATVAGSTKLYVALAGEVTAVDLTDLTASERVVRARDRHRDPAVGERGHALRLAHRPGARGRPGDGHDPSASSRRSMPARSTMSRPRCARSSGRMAATSSAPAER